MSEHDNHHHVTPLGPMVFTLVSLVVLTVVTVLTAKFVPLPGSGNLILALVIASIKGTFVAAFFMHLLYDKAVNTIVVMSSMFGVVLFIALTMVDIGTRKLHEPLEAGEIVAGGGAQWVERDGKQVVDYKGSYGPSYDAAPGKSVLDAAREASDATGEHAPDADEHNAETPANDAAHANTPATTEHAEPAPH